MASCILSWRLSTIAAHSEVATRLLQNLIDVAIYLRKGIWCLHVLIHRQNVSLVTYFQCFYIVKPGTSVLKLSFTALNMKLNGAGCCPPKQKGPTCLSSVSAPVDCPDSHTLVCSRVVVNTVKSRRNTLQHSDVCLSLWKGSCFHSTHSIESKFSEVNVKLTAHATVQFLVFNELANKKASASK